MITLPEALLAEIRRNREILDIYRRLGVAGVFAHAMISGEVKRAEDALASGDAVEMIRMLATLKENEA